MVLHDFSDIFKPSWMKESEEEKSKRDQIKVKLEGILNPSLLNNAFNISKNDFSRSP